MSYSGEGHLIEGQIEGDPDKTVIPVAVDSNGRLIIDLEASSITIGSVDLNDGAGNPISSTGGSLDVNVTNTPSNQNVTVVNAAGAAAVNIQDGGNSITVDGTITTTPPANASTNLTQVGGSAVSLGQKNSANSIPVVIASDQSAIPVTGTITTSPNVNVHDGSGNTISSTGTSLNVDVTNTVPISGSVSVSNFPATQPISGTVAVSNFPATQPISAVSLPLPTGAATEATLSTRLADTTFTTRINVQGQNTMAASTPVVLPSDQSDLPIKAGTLARVTAAWTNATALNTTISTSTAGYPTLLVSFNNTTGNGAVTLEASIDGGSTYPHLLNVLLPYPFLSSPLTVSGVIPMSSVAQSTGQEIIANVMGFTNVRVRLTTQPAGGTINVGLQVVNISSPAVIPGITYIDPLDTLGVSIDGTNGTQIPVQNTGAASNFPVLAQNPTAANLLALVSQPTAANLNATVRNQGAGGATLDSTIGAATAPANAFAVSVVCQTTPPSLTAGQAVAQQCDYQGSHFVKPYRRGQTNGQATTIASSSAATTVITAPAAGIFADISTAIITSTAQATGVAFTATLTDGTKSYIFDLNTGSTTVLQIAPQLHLTFNPPLPASTAATAWTIALSSNAVTVHITMGYILQKAS